MSSASAGKFQDHYEVLAIDPKAGSEAISAAYATLSQKYHPKNISTGDAEKFDAVNLAFEVLSDPILRKEFDKLKGIGDDGPPRFSGAGFFDLLGRDNGLRAALLSVLYERRRTKPFTPSLSMRNLEFIVEGTEVELNFTLWYLKQRGMVQSDDKSSLQITIAGMDFLEETRPTAAMVMPFIKASALTPAEDVPELEAVPDAPTAAAEEAPSLSESPKFISSAQRIMAAARLVPGRTA